MMKLKYEIRVILRPVVRIRNVETQMEFHLVLAWQILTARHQIADMNVQLTRNVPAIKRAFNTNAEIPVQDLVVLMPIVMFSTTIQLVHVLKDMLGTLSHNVCFLQLHVNIVFYIYIELFNQNTTFSNHTKS